jgi:hypothetical protein
MIAWIASYPRSGNTFFRAILHGLYGLESIVMQQVPEPAGPWLDAAAAAPEWRYLKTHNLPRDDNHPAVYLLRDGRDALVSYAWFMLEVRHHKARADITAAEFHAMLKELIETHDPGYGDWSDNVLAWTRRPNTFVIRYEDLVERPRELAVQSIAFLGVNLPLLPDATVPTFESMNQKNPKTVRRGKVGSWRDEFPQDLLPLFWQRHGAAMRALGYGEGEFVPAGPQAAPQVEPQWRTDAGKHNVAPAGRLAPAAVALQPAAALATSASSGGWGVRAALGAVKRQVRAAQQRYLEWRAPTIVHVTHWQAGAHWLYRILHRCCPYRTVPPTGAYGHLLAGPIQPGKIYPNVYATREQLAELEFPAATRRFVVIRDLRDTLVALFTAAKNLPVAKTRLDPMRQALATRNDEEGLLYLLEQQLPRCAAIQESWLGSGETLLRYEDLLQPERGTLERVLLDECRLPAAKSHVRDVVSNHVHNRGKRDLADWRKVFTPPVADAFKAKYGKLLVATGYETGLNW